MNIKSSTFIKTYWFSMLLIASIGIGSMLGIILKKGSRFPQTVWRYFFESPLYRHCSPRLLFHSFSHCRHD